MKSQVYWYSLCLLAFLAACKKEKNPEPEGNDPYKSELLSRMVVEERFWRVERLIRISGKDSTFMPHEDTEDWAKYWIEGINYRFLDGNQLDALAAIGVRGDLLPYGDQSTISYSPSSSEPKDGTWFWDEEKQTIAVEGFLPVNSVRGYLDKNTLPVCRNLSEAIALGRPERVNFVFPAAEGPDVTYVYCLRAAWPVEILAKDRYKFIVYRVLY